MKFISILTCFMFLQPTFGQQEMNYFFGEYIPIELLKCEEENVLKDSLLSRFDIGGVDSKYTKLIDFIPVNINENPKCEYLLVYSSSLLAKLMMTDIFEVNQQDQLVLIGSFTGKVHFTKCQENYLRIVQPTCQGHKTNCTYYPEEFAFTNSKYRSIKKVEINRGEYQSLGKSAFENGNYKLASAYYNNAYLTSTSQAGELLKIANDLSVTKVKLNDLEFAKQILKENMGYFPSKKLEAITYYNLGIINEKQGKSKEALKYFIKSNHLSPSRNTQNIIAILNTTTNPVDRREQ